MIYYELYQKVYFLYSKGYIHPEDRLCDLSLEIRYTADICWERIPYVYSQALDTYYNTLDDISASEFRSLDSLFEENEYYLGG